MAAAAEKRDPGDHMEQQGGVEGKGEGGVSAEGKTLHLVLTFGSCALRKREGKEVPRDWRPGGDKAVCGVLEWEIPGRRGRKCDLRQRGRRS